MSLQQRKYTLLTQHAQSSNILSFNCLNVLTKKKSSLILQTVFWLELFSLHSERPDRFFFFHRLIIGVRRIYQVLSMNIYLTNKAGIGFVNWTGGGMSQTSLQLFFQCLTTQMDVKTSSLALGRVSSMGVRCCKFGTIKLQVNTGWESLIPILFTLKKQLMYFYMGQSNMFS